MKFNIRGSDMTRWRKVILVAYSFAGVEQNSTGKCVHMSIRFIIKTNG